MKFLGKVLLCTAAAMAAGCSVSPPKNPNNICSIFREKPDWREDAMHSRMRWGAPVHITMAIMAQESSFIDDAKPPMQYFLWIIPIGRGSSAYGYAQAQDPVWEEYKKDVGGMFASRDDFGDAIDFIGWYVNKSYQRNSVSKWDAYNQYLNYHEGWGGYSRGSYKDKKWLLGVASKVKKRADQYAAQLKACP